MATDPKHQEQPKSPTRRGENADREDANRAAAARAEGRPAPRTGHNDPPKQTDGSGAWWVGDHEKSGQAHGYDGVSEGNKKGY